MDWDTVQLELERTFPVVSKTTDHLVIRIQMPVQTTEHLQDVGLRPTKVQDLDWLAMVSPVCAATQLDPREVLRFQDQLPLGALVLRDDTYVLRHGVLMPPLTAPALLWNVAEFAREALKVRINLRGPTDVQALAYIAE